MKKLLKCALSLATIAAVGLPQVHAATTPTYVIEVKSKKYSKAARATTPLKGVYYTENYSGYGDANWPLVECYTPFDATNDCFVATNDKGETKRFLIRQFGVSMGVVYWINPTQNQIHYWNTFTGETGTDTPEKGIRGAATPTTHKGYNYNGTSIPGQTGYNYPFSGAQTGMGSVTQDWHGNIVHQWNNVSGAGINTYTQGFAVYKAPSKFGELIDFSPRLSDMTTQTYPYKRRKLNGAYLVGTEASDHTQTNYSDDTNPNPNWVGNQISWGTNSYYHQWRAAYSGSTKQVVDFMGASGNLYGDEGLVDSDYFWGYWGGQVFLTYNGITFGNMFANGQYSNWYLNYDLYIDADVTSAAIISKGSYYGPGATPLSKYPREYMMRECDKLDYFWTIPVIGTHESTYTSGYQWRFSHYDLNTDENGTNLSMYTTSHPRYGYTMTGGYDAMNVPEVDSIKGQRVYIHNMWLQYWPENTAVTKNGTTYNMRDGQIQIRSCAYSGTFTPDGKNSDGTPNQWPGSPTQKYRQVGYGYGYNKQANDYVNVAGTNFDKFNTSVNCWSELERVNNNVFALYTNVPGKGFSKYYVTAVEQDNPVTNIAVTRVCHNEDATIPVDEDKIKVKITWTAQEHDRETLNRYEIWYQTFKRDANGNLVTDCDDTWTLAGIGNIDYSDKNYAENRTGTYIHQEVPYGTNSDGSTYDVTYKYMIIPIYDASNHRGTEAYGNTTVTSAAPRIPVDATLTQQTDNGKYSFNLQLDVKANANLEIPYADNNVKASIAKYVLVAEDEASATALAQATSVECLTSGVTVTTGTGTTPVFADHNCNHYTATGYYAIVSGFTSISTQGTALPSLVWHNVNPNVDYKVKVYGVANRGYNFIETAEITGTLVAPAPELSMTSATIQKLAGDYSELVEIDDLPMGAQLKAQSEEITNPVTMKDANCLGTRGSVIKPIMVTDEVLSNWNLQYTYNVVNGTETTLAEILPASDVDASIYSNSTSIFADVIGLPVVTKDWVTLKNTSRKGYDSGTESQQYQASVAVDYIRKDNASITAKSEQENPATIAMSLSNPFPALDIDLTNSIGALFYNSSTHWDEAYKGYYPHYYDAAVQFIWNAYTDDLNKYVGYHATTTMECLGHYTSESPNLWIEYYAGSVLTDNSVTGFNNSAAQNNVTQFLKGIGYDGTSNTDWSVLALNERSLPMMIHYVYGGEEKLTADTYQTAKMSAQLTADYPVVVSPMLVVNQYDESTLYSMETATRATKTLEVVSVPNNISNFHVDYFVTTGVEGIVTDACGGVQMYPNPVVNDFTLRAPMALNEVRIFTMDGQLVKVVKDITDTTATINVAELPQGMYLVNTLGMSQIMIKK